MCVARDIWKKLLESPHVREYSLILLCSFMLALALGSLILKFFLKEKTSGFWKYFFSGLIIYFPFLVSSFLIYNVSKFISYVEFTGIVAGGTLFFVLGLVVDVLSIPKKYFLGLMVCLIFPVIYFFGINTDIIFVPTLINYLITVVWAVFLINAFDSLCFLHSLRELTVFIASFFLLIFALLNQNFIVGVVLSIILGVEAAVCFFDFKQRFYWGKAQGFLLAYVLSIISIILDYADYAHVAIVVLTPVMLFLVPFINIFYAVLKQFKWFSVPTGINELKEGSALLLFCLLDIVCGFFGMLIYCLNSNILGIIIWFVTVCAFISIQTWIRSRLI